MGTKVEQKMELLSKMLPFDLEHPQDKRLGAALNT